MNLPSINVNGSASNIAETLTNKTINYDDNTMTGVQPTLTAGTGISIANSMISQNLNFVNGTETKTGSTYGGKPIYCYTNTMTGTEGTSGYTVIYGATISNIKDKIALEGFAINGGWGGSPLPYLYTSGGTVTRHYEIWFNGNQVAANLYGMSAYNVSIKYYAFYTKITD